MYTDIDSSFISLNSDVLETNILNLLVVIIALGTLIQQYFTSVIKSYEIPLYESVNDLYLLEKEIQAIKDDTITSKAVVIRMYLNALMLSKYSLLEVNPMVNLFGLYTLLLCILDPTKMKFRACSVPGPVPL